MPYSKRKKLSRNKYLSPDEVQRLLSAPDKKALIGSRDYAILRTFLSTGLRKSELINLNCEDLLADNDHWYFIVKSKGGNEEEQPFEDDETKQAIVHYLRKWERSDKAVGPLFIAKKCGKGKGGERISGSAMDYMIKKYFHLAAIEKQPHVHMLRHTYGTELYKKTKDTSLVMNAMRHRSVASTMVYVHSDERDIRAGLRRVHF